MRLRIDFLFQVLAGLLTFGGGEFRLFLRRGRAMLLEPLLPSVFLGCVTASVRFGLSVRQAQPVGAELTGDAQDGHLCVAFLNGANPSSADKREMGSRNGRRGLG